MTTKTPQTNSFRIIQGKKILIGILVVAILAGGFLVWKDYQAQKEVLISTDKEEYKEGENPKIKIRNNSAEKVCFFSCYPYYLEKK